MRRFSVAQVSVSFICLVCACKQEAPKSVPAASTEATAKLAATDKETSTVTTASEKAEGDCHHEDAPAEHAAVLKKGDALKGDKPVALADLLATPEKFDTKTVLTEGTVRQVCQKAGCWMELATDDKSPGARVTFKDYAFFVPKDSQKNHAKVEGVVKLAELSEARAKHYTDEGATVPRGKDGKAREVQIVASGVELTKPQ
jgi:Domain of unknown function (DUF4920)